jgi:DNA invertase Pin-like site-specific DNA recombinase
MNLFNDFYAKDTSRKIRAVKKAQAERASAWRPERPTVIKKMITTQRKMIVPDEDAAPVVQRIFSLCAGGKRPSQIARQLKKEQVLTPGNYYYQ